MARHLFGGSIPDYVVAPGDSVTVGGVTGNQVLLVPSQPVTFWSAISGGTQYTDLLDLTDAAITSVTSDSSGALPQFRGPDGVTVMWADAGGSRRLVIATDLGTDIGTLQSTVATLQTTVNALSAYSPTFVYRDPGTGAWPARPSVSGRVWWIETKPTAPAAPTIDATYMADGLDYYIGQAGA